MINNRLLIVFGAIGLTTLIGFIGYANIQTTVAGPLADTTIDTVEGALSYSPSIVSIQVGDTITFTNAGSTDTSPGFHNVDFADDVEGGSIPNGWTGASQTTIDYWEIAVTFDEPGTYFFFCTPHRSSGMVGRITVEDNSSTTPIPPETPMPTEIPTETPSATPDPATLDEYIYLPHLAVP
ncbi:MAG: plastocyanin/azurin family copper-binding protein [Chloroflexota bacterium]